MLGPDPSIAPIAPVAPAAPVAPVAPAVTTNINSNGRRIKVVRRRKPQQQSVKSVIKKVVLFHENSFHENSFHENLETPRTFVPQFEPSNERNNDPRILLPQTRKNQQAQRSERKEGSKDVLLLWSIY